MQSRTPVFPRAQAAARQRSCSQSCSNLGPDSRLPALICAPSKGSQRPREHNAEGTQCRANTMPRGRNAERTQCRGNTMPRERMLLGIMLMHLFCWNRTQQSLVISTVNNVRSILARPILARVILARPILARSLRFSMQGRRRGGAVQRARAPKRPRLEVPEFGKSELAYFLVREVVWGAMSPQLATKVATLALRDLALAK